MKNYFFFLSYARRDSNKPTQDHFTDPYIKRFYKDLTNEIAKVAGLPSNVKNSEIGFMDEEGIEVGQEWDIELADALQFSRCFLCLYSPSYFKSEMCGKEFYTFRARQEDYREVTKDDSLDLIIPILWERPARLPAPLPQAVRTLQYSHASYPALYAQEGLSVLLRLKENTDVYQKFLIVLAERIYSAVTKYTLPPLQSVRPLLSVPNAFGDSIEVASLALEQGTSTPTLPVPEPVGPDVAWFVFLVGRPEDYLNVRKKHDCYGPLGGIDWRPYLPDVQMKMGLLTQGIATTKNMFHHALSPAISPSGQLIKHLRAAEDKNTIVIMIVDPWSVRLPSHKVAMTEYDQNRLSNCEVIIVWNEKDPETVGDHTLREEIVNAFFRSAGAEEFHDSVRCLEDFQKKLSNAIDSIQKKVMRRMSLFRPTPTRSPIPILSIQPENVM